MEIHNAGTNRRRRSIVVLFAIIIAACTPAAHAEWRNFPQRVSSAVERYEIVGSAAVTPPPMPAIIGRVPSAPAPVRVARVDPCDTDEICQMLHAKRGPSGQYRPRYAPPSVQAPERSRILRMPHPDPAPLVREETPNVTHDHRPLPAVVRTAKVATETPRGVTGVTSDECAKLRLLHKQNPAHPVYRWAPHVEQAAREAGMTDCLLIAAMITKESRGNPEARGTRGEIGLMQILPSTAQERFGYSNVRILFDPMENIRTGARYLAEHFRNLGSIRSAVARYNGSGPAAERYAASVLAIKQGMLRA